MMALWTCLTLALISGSLCSTDADFTYGPFNIQLGDRWNENNDLSFWIGGNFDVVNSKSQAADFYIYGLATPADFAPNYDLWTDSQHKLQVYQVNQTDKTTGGYFSVLSKDKIQQVKLEYRIVWQVKLQEYPVTVVPFDVKCPTSDGYGYVYKCGSKIVRAYKDKDIKQLGKMGCQEVNLLVIKPESKGAHKSKKFHHR